MITDQTDGHYKCSTPAIPRSRSEVRYVYHATHIEFALDMIKDIKLDSDGRWKCKVEFKTSPSRKAHNTHVYKKRNMLFFACELGDGWSKKRSRYGNIMFKFPLRDVLREFASVSHVSDDQLRFHAMGTTVYKAEHSHKVLVTPPNCSEVEDGAFPLLPRIGEFTDEFFPLTRDEKGTWLQTNSAGMDQMEFVLLFQIKPWYNPNYAIMTLSGEMEFYAHDEICVSVMRKSSKAPVHCDVRETQVPTSTSYMPKSSKAPVHCDVGETKLPTSTSYHTSERADADDAKAEFAAAVILTKKIHLNIIHDTFESSLDERIEKLKRLYPERRNDPHYTLLREFPKFYYTARYYEEQSPEFEEATGLIDSYDDNDTDQQMAYEA